jgi:hypothetical protein
MGSFFTNVHVRITPDSLRRVRAAIEEAAAADGFLLARADDVVDRTVLIAKTASPDWIVVYDQSSDAMDVRALETLGRATSKGGFAVTALVHDSDDLLITLFKDGVRKDKIAFTPGGEAPKIKPAGWKALLGAEKARNFERALKKRAVFAEQPLEALSNLLDWDPAYAFLGYAYRDELPSPPAETLKFTLPEEKRFYTFDAGPPVLESFIEHTKVTMALGIPLEGLGYGVTFQNIGGAGRGLTAIIEYTAEVEEYLDIRAMVVGVGAPGHEITMPIEVVAAEKARYLRARFPDLHLPPAPKWTPQRRKEWQAMRIFELSQLAHIRVHAAGFPKKAGSVTTTMWVLPHENAEEGAGWGELEAEIRPEPWWKNE